MEVNPSFKKYVYEEGVGFDVDVNDMTEGISSSIRIYENRVYLDQSKLVSLFEEQVALIEETHQHLSVDEILGTRSIIPGVINVPEILEIHSEFSDLLEDLKFKMKVVFPNGEEHIMTLSKVLDKRISIFHDPVNPGYFQEIINRFGGLFDVPVPSDYLKVVPVLQIGDEKIIGTEIIGMGLTQTIQIGFLRPGGQWENSTKKITAGSRYGISIATQRTSFEEAMRLSNLFEKKLMDAGYTDSSTEPLPDDMMDEMLRLTGMMYFTLLDQFTEYGSKMNGVIGMNYMSMAFICKEITPRSCFGNVFSLKEGGVHMDVIRNAIYPISLSGNKDDEFGWFTYAGALGTNLEHAVIEMLFGVMAVSTGKVIDAALKRNTRMYVLDDPETMEDSLYYIYLYKNEKAEIRQWVEAGYVVTVPHRRTTVIDPITGGKWTGQCWIVTDPETGGTGHMISGTLHGASSLPVGRTVARGYLFASGIAEAIIAAGGFWAVAGGAGLAIGVLGKMSPLGFWGAFGIGIAGLTMGVFILGGIAIAGLLLTNLWIYGNNCYRTRGKHYARQRKGIEPVFV